MSYERIQTGGGVRTADNVMEDERVRVAKPSMYRVILVNDDYTPMEFVVHVLEKVFHKCSEEAHRIMLQVHHNGRGLCGVYPFEIAESRSFRVMDWARRCQHPLRCYVERD
ncbi:MAG: ATP-dependent Clp protease adapter ClpS [Alphaproteobacteria bacterium GM202ARS2]|nr:ATP-dependent Clp protease adapter ClpS [Alphaproteobacteria bacterium GM202ARS2]